MKTISSFCKDAILTQTNEQIRELHDFGRGYNVEIRNGGFGTFEPAIHWMSSSCNGADAEMALAYADALRLAAELLEAMPAKGAKVTY